MEADLPAPPGKKLPVDSRSQEDAADLVAIQAELSALGITPYGPWIEQMRAIGIRRGLGHYIRIGFIGCLLLGLGDVPAAFLGPVRWRQLAPAFYVLSTWAACLLPLLAMDPAGGSELLRDRLSRLARAIRDTAPLALLGASTAWALNSIAPLLPGWGLLVAGILTTVALGGALVEQVLRFRPTGVALASGLELTAWATGLRGYPREEGHRWAAWKDRVLLLVSPVAATILAWTAVAMTIVLLCGGLLLLLGSVAWVVGAVFPGSGWPSNLMVAGMVLAFLVSVPLGVGIALEVIVRILSHPLLRALSWRIPALPREQGP